MYRRSFIYSIGIIFILFGFPFTKIHASCPFPSGTNKSLGANTCVVATLTGLDNAALTLDNAISLLNINSGGKLCLGSLLLPTGGGILSMQAGGTGIMKTGCSLYMVDADSDGYPVNTTLYDAAGTGRRKLSLLTSLTNIDCNDANAATYANAVCYVDADGDGVYSPTVTGSICGTSATCPGTSANPGTDCNDGAVAVWTSAAGSCYWDSDNDGYGNLASLTYTCFNAATCATVTAGGVGTAAPITGTNFASNKTDCNDGAVAVWTSAAGSCYQDIDNDGYGNLASLTYTCFNAATCATATAGSVGATLVTSTNFASNQTDCNDGAAVVWTSAPGTCYRDGDNDGYGSSGSYSYTCFNAATCAVATAGSVGTGTLVTSANFTTDKTDCCDTDANAHPGQTAYFTTARTTCGGFDYNCVNGEEHYYTGSGAYMSCSPNSSTQSCDSVGGSDGWTTGDPGCGIAANWKIAGCCNPSGDCTGTAYPACGAGNLANYNYTQQCR